MTWCTVSCWSTCWISWCCRIFWSIFRWWWL